jgi:plasmid stabilization system protein ParE
MANRLIISSLAQNQLTESSNWYEEQTLGLGERFAEIIYNNLNKISKDPEIYKKTKRNLREFVVDKFPFIIVYEYYDDTINIVHIFHTSRNPKLKYKR